MEVYGRCVFTNVCHLANLLVSMESRSNGAQPSSADGPVHAQPVVSVGDLVLAALLAQQQVLPLFFFKKWKGTKSMEFSLVPVYRCKCPL